MNGRRTSPLTREQVPDRSADAETRGPAAERRGATPAMILPADLAPGLDPAPVRRNWIVPLLCALVAAFDLHAQTLANPGFEMPYTNHPPTSSCPRIGGQIAAGWIDNSCWTGNETADVTYARETVGVHGGGSSQRITSRGGIMQFAQSLAVQKDRIYTLTIWMRSSATLPVNVMLRKLGPPYSAYATATFDVSPSWTQYTVRGIAADDDAFFMVRTEVAGTLWVDDATIASAPFALPLPDTPVPRSFVGLHFHDPLIPWPPIARLSAVRIWDADGIGASDCAQWACIHRGPGQFDWGSLDRHVDRALASGADVLFVLGRGPQWASARPNEPSPYGPGQAAEPASMQTWRDWVLAVGTRYAGRIRYWETWNEPNDSAFFSGTPETLLALSREAHAILKSIDPSNRLVSPSPYDLGYLDRYLSLGGGMYADVIGYHFYIIGSAPEILYTSYLPNARLILQNHGLDDRPLWNTEAGWFALPELPDEIGVAYVARSYLLNWARGVDRFYYYAWDQFPAGIELSSPPNFDVPTAAGVAYHQSTRWLVGSRMSGLTVDPQGTWIVELLHANGTTGRVVWNPARSAANPLSFPVPLGWNVRWRRNLAGVVDPLPPGASIPIDGRPVLLEAAIDLDADAVDDLDDNCPGAANPPQADADADGVGDACDNCPQLSNPQQQAVPFPSTISAASVSQFCWTGAADVVWVVGNLAELSSYSILASAGATNATCVSHPVLPTSGSGFYYLLRPDCAAGSWQSTIGAEPGRDTALP